MRVLDGVANSFFFSVWNCSSVSKIQLHAHIVNLREYPLGVNSAHSFFKSSILCALKRYIYRLYMEVVVGDYKFKFVKWASISVHKRYTKVQRRGTACFMQH